MKPVIGSSEEPSEDENKGKVSFGNKMVVTDKETICMAQTGGECL